MKRVVRSMGFALSGLQHAVRVERNIRQFLLCLIAYVGLGIYLQFWPLEWVIVALTSAMFLIVELLNTSIERLGDAIDDVEKKRKGGHFHLGIKQSKDIAAGASFITLLVVVFILGSLLSLHLVDFFSPITVID